LSWIDSASWGLEHQSVSPDFESTISFDIREFCEITEHLVAVEKDD
jgi:hypothetical protein